jgi:hypothetical protein
MHFFLLYNLGKNLPVFDKGRATQRYSFITEQSVISPAVLQNPSCTKFYILVQVTRATYESK